MGCTGREKNSGPADRIEGEVLSMEYGVWSRYQEVWSIGFSEC
jgi:hypothetical protein